jgi:hypothetical protein
VIKVAVSQDAREAKIADFTVNLKTPLADKDIPAAGFEFKLQPAAELDGTYDTYTQPVLATAAPAPAAAPVPAAAAPAPAAATVPATVAPAPVAAPVPAATAPAPAAAPVPAAAILPQAAQIVLRDGVVVAAKKTAAAHKPVPGHKPAAH